MAKKGSTLETLLNGSLADLLRTHGLEAEAEQVIRDRDGRNHQVDVLVELEEHAVAIEAEFAPARTVIADARKRLPEHPLYWRGLPVACAFTLVYPETLRAVPESQARTQLATCNVLEFSQLFPDEVETQARLFPAAKPTSDTVGTTSGSVVTLAECLHNFWLRAESSSAVEETIRDASDAIARASACLSKAPHLHPRAADDSDPAATSALIWLNALLFQELLAQNLSPESLPPEHRDKRILPPDSDGDPDTLMRQWKEILTINWWPIFHYATEALRSVPTRPATLALKELRPVARTIAKRGVIRRHDIAGRIFHRLLNTRKFLATNYTTIPAAVLLAGLAFDPEASPWKAITWNNREAISKLRIVDPACGSGTLLMAAVQEVLKRHRRQTEQAEEPETIRTLLEKAIYGYDVVPAAIHLTAATLAMAESRQVINNMPLYWMPHDVDKRPRLGSLDFLARSVGRGKAHHLPMFPDATRGPDRRTGTGKSKHDVFMPDCDLVIANPPYTRAGGPGSADNTAWNPIFGSVLSKTDAKRMQQALQKMLHGTPASTYAGLGSAFLTLADERLKPGGRLAFVLPLTALTGSRWASIRELLIDNYDIEWVVVSHDNRNRPAKGKLPGRRYVAFSESCRIAETLLVATKKSPPSGSKRSTLPITRFVNLRQNPDEPIEAIAIARALLTLKTPPRSRRAIEITLGPKTWGEVLFVPQRKLDQHPWLHTAFVQGRVTETALTLRDKGLFRIDTKKTLSIPLARMGELCELGPAEMQIKNPKQGLFTIVETDDPSRTGHPALWHHSARRITRLEVAANARLRERGDQSTAEQQAMLARAGRLHIARELGHAPQRLAVVQTNEPMLGVRSWITVIPRNPSFGKEEALCLWLNSTPGLLLRLVHANRPYLGRSALPHELLQTLPVLNVDRLSQKQRHASQELFTDLKAKPLQGFAHLADDPVRRELDHRFFSEVLGHDAGHALDAIAKALNREPTITTRH